MKTAKVQIGISLVSPKPLCIAEMSVTYYHTFCCLLKVYSHIRQLVTQMPQYEYMYGMCQCQKCDKNIFAALAGPGDHGLVLQI